MCANAFFFVVVVRVVSFSYFFFKPETRGLPTDIYRSILVHFLFTDWSVYLYTSRSAVPLEKMTETFIITIGTQEFRLKRGSSRRRQ